MFKYCEHEIPQIIDLVYLLNCTDFTFFLFSSFGVKRKQSNFQGVVSWGRIHFPSLSSIYMILIKYYKQCICP